MGTATLTPDNRRVPRVSEPLDDTTSLDASRIDIGARIGWLLRVSRSAGGYSLRQMAAALEEHGVSVSAATLSRIESDGLRSVVALDGYATVLGLADGALRVPVDLLCRSFSYGPSTRVPAAEPTLERFSRACRAVEVDHPTGGDWLEFIRQHGDDTPFGLPEHVMRAHVRRLALEQCRSVGLTRWVRYEALLWLRFSVYDDLVAEVAAEILADPDLQVGEDLMTAVAERPTRGVVRWTGELLQRPSVYQARSASYAIQSMLVTGGGLELADWESLPGAFDAAWQVAEGDPVRRQALSELHAALPPPVQRQVTAVNRPPPPAPAPRVWTRDRQNVHYGFAISLAHEVTSARGLPDDPMLARLLFESMYDPRGVRMYCSTVLIAASPYSRDLVHVLLSRRGCGPDDHTRTAAARVAAFCHVDEELPDVGSLLSSTSPLEFQHAVRIYGDTGHLLPETAVARGLAGDEMLACHTLTALGRAGDPRLVDIASDAARPGPVRTTAAWWLRHGPRITQ